MKLHILSDLHLEFAPIQLEKTDADIVILAGDIQPGAEGVTWAKESFDVPVLYVPGNHEYYDSVWPMDSLLSDMHAEAVGSDVHVLDRASFELEGVRFLATTLWTDLYDKPFAGVESGVIGSDMGNIRASDGEMFHGDVAQVLFERNRDWLKTQLSQAFDGRTVVITHHAPSGKSMHAQYEGNPWNSCFITDMEQFMGDQVDLWVHGHTHNNFDYKINGTRVVCNPRGYPHPLGGWENLQFDAGMCVTVRGNHDEGIKPQQTPSCGATTVFKHAHIDFN
ncbi:MAG: metallophosphoesterase family protein [Mariprofundaceae bacterium]